MNDLSIGEVAAEMGVSEEAVRRWVRRGELQAYKAGGLWRVTRSDLDAYKRRTPSQGSAEGRTG